MKRRIWLPIPLAMVIAACLAPRSAECQEASAATGRHMRVVSLDAIPPDSYWAMTYERIFRERLTEAFGDRLAYHYERLEAYDVPDSSYESDFEDYLVRKYHDRPVDLLLASKEVIAFAARLQARLAGNPPIVFRGRITERPVPKSTGVIGAVSLKESLALALRVHPQTRHVFIVIGATPVDQVYDDLFQSQVPVAPPGVDLTYLRGIPVPALLERLAALPPRSVVLLVFLNGDSQGRPIRAISVIGRFLTASTAPIYTWNGSWVGSGAFGGHLVSAERVAEASAQLAVRVLRGERPEDVPLAPVENVDALDWRQLDRWNVSEARLPPGVELRFREPGFFQQYRSYILSAAGVLLLQTLLIAGLLIQRRNRRLAERSLRESEERFRVMADTAPVMVWRSGPDQQCDFFNQPWLEFRGRRLEDELGDGWTEGVHPDDLDHCLTIYRGAWPDRQSFRIEYRLRRADGTYRWVLDSGVPRLAPDGALLGYIGSCIDITERRQAEEALRSNETALRQSHTEIQDLAGRLITAQEAERARIARDLHDDVSQKLAGISIALGTCRRRPDMRGNDDLLAVLTGAQQQVIELSNDIRLLSHDLHPGVLEHAGFVDALRSHCSEFAAQQSIDVEVDADDDLVLVDMETTLCLYRIVQEALRNIAKHASARHVRVTARRVEDEVHLAITDDGKGFDLMKVREGGGLGLRSIDERVRLVGGRLSIETMPFAGTRITVWVKTTAPAVGAFA